MLQIIQRSFQVFYYFSLFVSSTYPDILSAGSIPNPPPIHDPSFTPQAASVMNLSPVQLQIDHDSESKIYYSTQIEDPSNL